MFKRPLGLPKPAPEKNAEIIMTQTGFTTLAKDQSPPSSYSDSYSRFQEDPPDISAAFANLTLNNPCSPALTRTSDQYMVHVKLLEEFDSLRDDIS